MLKGGQGVLAERSAPSFSSYNRRQGRRVSARVSMCVHVYSSPHTCTICLQTYLFIGSCFEVSRVCLSLSHPFSLIPCYLETVGGK